MAEAKRLVLKIGSSSVTGVDGRPDAALMERIAGELTAAMHAGWDVVVVSSGAVTAGWSVIGDGKDRPDDPGVLQAISAIGQHRLMSMWADAFSAHDYTVGQVLLARLGEADPEQYLNAQQTFAHLFDLGVVPIINENDAVADDEIRFGDNDRLAALVAHLIHATHFVMLTDAPGLLTADPRIDAEASLIEIVTEIDRTLEQLAGGPGEGATGGMASKLAAARIATWSGVETIIADARTPGVIAALDHPETLVGTTFRARTSRLSAHKLWIAFALGTKGRLVIDNGARQAIVEQGASLLGVGIQEITGSFEAGDAVEVASSAGELVAKGIVRVNRETLEAWKAHRDERTDGIAIHRDDLVVFALAGSNSE
jgi:glutamate 5-kinase